VDCEPGAALVNQRVIKVIQDGCTHKQPTGSPAGATDNVILCVITSL
jgi:hypothetical protein